MPRIVESTVYKFDELSDRAKDKARDWFRQTVFTDSCDWDCVYEDAATIAAIIGIDIRQRAVPLMNGKTRLDPAIYFSGFWSQGDGACFEGFYSYKADAIAKLVEHAPNDSELVAIAESLHSIEGAAFFSAAIKHRDRYYHEYSMDISVEFDDSAWRDATGASEDDEFPQDKFTVGEEVIIEAMRDFARWIYRQLESEYDYQSSDETIDENIRANEYEFDADGSIA